LVTNLESFQVETTSRKIFLQLVSSFRERDKIHDEQTVKLQKEWDFVKGKMDYIDKELRGMQGKFNDYKSLNAKVLAADSKTDGLLEEVESRLLIMQENAILAQKQFEDKLSVLEQQDQKIY